MRFRRLRNVARGKHSWIVIVSSFLAGMLFGWTSSYSAINSLHIKSAGDAQTFDRSKNSDAVGNAEIVSPIKLSVNTDTEFRPFSRLPPNYEKNIYPPRAAAKEFPLEPHTVIARNRAKDKSRSSYFMLFIVKSSPVHTTRREVIRKTWGAVKVIDGLFLNTIFVIGNVGKDLSLQALLAKENDLNGDLLQTDTAEGYRNLPAKVLSAMQWLISKSSDISSDFYTFTDDDCVMNIANIVDFFGVLPFINEELKPPVTENRSRAPVSVKEIQSIQLYKKKTVKEVTLKGADTVQSPENIEFEGKAKDVSGVRPLEQENFINSLESDVDLVNNPKFRAVMDRNAEMENAEHAFMAAIPELSQFYASTSDIYFKSFNLAYAHNADNLTSYLKLALGRNDDPSAKFRSRTLKPDTIYCGFSYDPRGKPHRKGRDKWMVTLDQYSEQTYPSFCHGGMYVMSGLKMTSIFAISTVTDWTPFHLEDVLVTGILREKTGVSGSKLIRRGSDPKTKPLMYYVRDSGPRVTLKMSRKWKYLTRQLLTKRFVMEAMRDGNVISWNNYAHQL